LITVPCAKPATKGAYEATPEYELANDLAIESCGTGVGVGVNVAVGEGVREGVCVAVGVNELVWVAEGEGVSVWVGIVVLVAKGSSTFVSLISGAFLHPTSANTKRRKHIQKSFFMGFIPEYKFSSLLPMLSKRDSKFASRFQNVQRRQTVSKTPKPGLGEFYHRLFQQLLRTTFYTEYLLSFTTHSTSALIHIF